MKAIPVHQHLHHPISRDCNEMIVSHKHLISSCSLYISERHSNNIILFHSVTYYLPKSYPKYSHSKAFTFSQETVSLEGIVNYCYTESHSFILIVFTKYWKQSADILLFLYNHMLLFCSYLFNLILFETYQKDQHIQNDNIFKYYFKQCNKNNQKVCINNLKL